MFAWKLNNWHTQWLLFPMVLVNLYSTSFKFFSCIVRKYVHWKEVETAAVLQHFSAYIKGETIRSLPSKRITQTVTTLMKTTLVVMPCCSCSKFKCNIRILYIKIYGIKTSLWEYLVGHLEYLQNYFITTIKAQR